MAWPVSQDYNEAIQNPQSSFNDPELRGGEATTNALGMPMPRSGNFADVYEFNSPATNSKWAVKCFTRQVAGLSERYAEISASLSGAKLPFAVEFQYLEQGMRVRGDWYPILKMRWVEGLLLNELVRDNLDKPAVLGQLGQIWARMAKRLRESGLAHADLQHGNVILVPGSKAGSLSVKLIDYDGMFVPALAKKKSGEVGHPNYQHPQRLREGTYSAEVDRFPLLVVATSLKALSIGGRELWDRYDNSDNLLFRESDLQAPGKSALFTELHNLPDAQMKKLAEALHEAAEGKLEAVPTLEDLFAEQAKPRTNVHLNPVTPAAKEPEVVEEAAEKEETLEDIGDTRPSRPERKESPRGVPPWAWAAGGAGVLAVGAIAAVVIALLVMIPRGEPKKDSGPIVQRPDDSKKDVAKVKKGVTPIDPIKDKGGDSRKDGKDVTPIASLKDKGGDSKKDGKDVAPIAPLKDKGDDSKKDGKDVTPIDPLKDKGGDSRKDGKDVDPVVKTPLPDPTRSVVRIDGKSGIRLSKSAGLLNLNKDFTIEMWVRFAQDDRRVLYLAGDEAWPGMHPKVSVTRASGWVIRTRPDAAKGVVLDFTIACELAGGGKTDWVTTLGEPGLLKNAGFEHVAVCRWNQMITVYWNGKRYTSLACAGKRFVPSPTDCFVGSREDAYVGRVFKGEFAEFAMSARARYTKDFVPPKTIDVDQHSLCALDFSTGEGTKLTDLSRRGHDGIFPSGSTAQWLRAVVP